MASAVEQLWNVGRPEPIMEDGRLPEPKDQRSESPGNLTGYQSLPGENRSGKGHL